MSKETNPTLNNTPTPTEPTKTPVPRADQDQKIANDIAEAGRVIETVRAQAALAAAVAARGYDETKLTAGKELQGAAQAAFNARQAARAAQKEKTEALKSQIKAAKLTYTDFRETVRAVFSSASDRAALGLQDKVPLDLQKFVTTARASYTAARTELFLGALSAHGWKIEQITAAEEQLSVLNEAEVAQQEAIGAATTARAARDAAHRSLIEWVRRFRRIARLALREEEGLKRMVGV